MATKTTLDSDTTKPSTTAPGDGPADTTDPTEHASSAPFRPSDEAITAGTVNAVVPRAVGASKEARRDETHDRIETYVQVLPNGTEVTMRHNIETGKTEISEED